MIVDSPLLLATIQTNPYVDPSPSGRWGRSTEELASELLPPDVADEVVAHEVERPLAGRDVPYAVTFFEKPKATADGFCVLKKHRVHPAQTPLRAWQSTHVRLGACPDGKGIFAHVQPHTHLAEAKYALALLSWATERAQSDDPVEFEIACKSETEDDRCAKGARAALAELPIEKTFIVGHGEGAGEWEYAVAETQPGQMLWDVRVSTRGRRVDTVQLTWKIPAPF